MSDEDQRTEYRRTGDLVSVAIKRAFGVEKEQMSFIQTLRRAFTLSNAALSPFALAYGVYWIWMGAIGDAQSGVGTIIEGVLMFQMGVSLIINFILSRVWKTMSDTHFNIAMWTVLAPCAMLPFTIPEFGVALLLWYIFQCVVGQTKHAPVQGSIIFIVQILNCYNTSYEDDPGATLLYIPGARRGGPPLEQLGQQIGSTIVLNAIAVGMWLQQVEYRDTYEENKTAKQSREAVRMSYEVVDLLKRYDTEGVRRCLMRYDVQGVVDPDLLKAFQSLKDNLDMYRPHLPNYVFIQDDSDEEGGPLSPLTYNQNPSKVGSSVVDPMEVESLDDEGELNSFRSSGDGDSPQSPPLENSSRNKYKRGAPSSNNTLLSNTSGAVERPRSGLMKSVQGEPMTASKKVTLALIDFHVGSQRCNDNMGRYDLGDQSPGSSFLSMSSSKSPSQSPRTTGSNPGVWDATSPKASSGPAQNLQQNHEQNLQRFVDAVYALALQHQASVHSLLGDVVQLSWNATTRITQHELKAARFLSQIAREARFAGPAIQVSGAACSGQVKVHVISSSTKQKALLVHNEWDGLLRGCTALGRRNKAMIIDRSTYNQANLEVECRGVDVVYYRPRAAVGPREKSYRLLIDDPDGALAQQQQAAQREAEQLYTPRANDLVVSSGSLSGTPLGKVPDYEPSGELRETSSPRQHDGEKRSSINAGGYWTPNANLSFNKGHGAAGAGAASASAAALQTVQVFDPPEDIATAQSLVYEVVREFKHRDQEWMYQVQRATSGNNPNAIVTKALESVVSGQIAEALTQLYELEDTGRSVTNSGPRHSSASISGSFRRGSAHSPPSPGQEYQKPPPQRRASDGTSAAIRQTQLVMASPMVKRLVTFCEKKMQGMK